MSAADAAAGLLSCLGLSISGFILFAVFAAVSFLQIAALLRSVWFGGAK